MTCASGPPAFQRLQRLLGPALLHQPQDGVEDHDGQDGGRLDIVAQQGGNDRGHDQDDDDKVVELGEQALQKGGARRLGEFVGPILLAARGDLVLVETAIAHGAQTLVHVTSDRACQKT